MPKKKVYYYKVDCINKCSGAIEDHKLLIENIKEIRELNEIKNKKKPKTHKLTGGNDINNIMLDELDFNDKYLFGRMCKEKDYTELLKRDYENFNVNTALNGEKQSIGFEIASYFLLDFEKGILSFCKSLGGPKESDFKLLFKDSRKIRIELEDIPNKNAIDLIYNDKGTELVEIELEIPTPSYEFFEEIVFEKGIPTKEEAKIIEKIKLGSDKVYLKIGKSGRESLINHAEDSRSIIDMVKDSISRYSKAKIRGKSSGVKSAQTFDLMSHLFSYEIIVRYEEMTRNSRKRMPLERIDESYKNGIEYAYYNINKDLLSNLINR